MSDAHLAASGLHRWGWTPSLRRASGVIFDPASGALLVTPALVVLTLMNLLPILWSLGMSFFRYRADRPYTPPRFVGLGNYVQLVTDPDIWERFQNTGVLIACSVLVQMVISGLAAYAFAGYPMRGRNYYLFYILAVRMMPPLTVIIPLYLIYRLIGLGGTYTGIILIHTAFNLRFAIWMLKSFLEELHRPIEEAAWLDGSSTLRILRRICIPQIRAGIAATAVIAFVFTWNDFLFSLLITGADTKTISVAMSRIIGADMNVDWGVFAAMGTVYLLPVVLVAFFLQNQLLRGTTFGTVPR